MKYQIQIAGMHCKGCASLIQMTLEEGGFENINIDLQKNSADLEFNPGSQSQSEAEAKTKLDEAFQSMPGYSYSDLKSLSKT
jgi:copper chaperone CopZ